MNTIIFEEIKSLLQKGLSERGHAFRFCTVATIDANLRPQQRTMVLREVTDTLALVLYTDARSNKLKEISATPNISVLFYDPIHQIQISISGLAEILTPETLAERWHKVQQGTSINDYCTTQAPGTSIENPTDVAYNYDQPHFAAIRVLPTTIEYLRLNQSGHTKIKYSLEENYWKSSFLVP